MNSECSKSTDTILCIGSAGDVHVQQVKKCVKAIDDEINFVVFDPLCGNHFIEIKAGFRPEEKCSCTLIVDEKRIVGDSIRAVWYRWKPAVITTSDDLQTLIAKDFALQEWKSVIRSLPSYLPKAKWMNPLAATELLNCKPYQLKLAQEAGLIVPITTITNNSSAVGNLFNHVDNGRVIFKSLTPLFLPPNKLLFTNEIKKEFTLECNSNITECPSIYQELVERSSDLRITVVGREVFVARIASQIFDNESDRLDWRRRQEQQRLYSNAQIPESLKERLLKFHEKAGLVFGAYDFLERGNDVIFLECNPGGAWLWLEQNLGLNVSQHVARYLLDA